MTFLLVPGDCGTDWATVWVGAVDEAAPSAAQLELVVAGTSVGVGSWDRDITGGSRRVLARRVRIGGLPERTRRRVELRRAGQVLATATIGTLPRRLPDVEAQPFTILLGSCFAQRRDGAGNVGRSYALLPTGARPDVKVLCGDQVYLDAPSRWTIFPALNEGELRRRLLSTYLDAWTQDPGFGSFLRDGPNVFTSDDHDYWNNAPNPSITAPATLIPPLREVWLKEAKALYDAFEQPLPAGVRSMDMTGLSIRVADTRVDRTPRTAAFMDAQDLDAIAAWAGGLASPGCLVVGQLVFSGRSGWKGQFTDFGLPDFDQYPALVDALRHARHTVLILTGDVHFGRVAVCQLEPGRDLIEIVASPLALVGPVPPNDWHPAPPTYPAEAIPGQVQRPLRTEAGYRLNANHFATVSFARSGGWVRVRVQAWPTELRGALPVPTQTWERLVA